MKNPSSSIFKKLMSEEITPWYPIHQSEITTAFLDNGPQGPSQKGHTLIVPNQQINHITDVPEETMVVIFELSEQIGNALDSKDRVGMVAGFEVPHLHYHVIPDLKGNVIGENIQTTEMQLQTSLDETNINLISKTENGISQYEIQNQGKPYQVITLPKLVTSNHFQTLIQFYQEFRNSIKPEHNQDLNTRLGMLREVRNDQQRYHTFPIIRGNLKENRLGQSLPAGEMVTIQNTIKENLQ